MKTFNFKALFSLKLKTKIDWVVVDNDAYQMEASYKGRVWNISVNDYPEEDLYTLYIDGVKELDFNSWPTDYWSELPVEEFERLLEKKGYLKK
jgi:hypothetical protein